MQKNREIVKPSKKYEGYDFHHLSHLGFDTATGAFDVCESTLCMILLYCNVFISLFRVATLLLTGRNCLMQWV